jgi:folate-dependent phosphoribosylglycinamide formyltransferase PurN
MIHKINEKIDDGKYLFQKKITNIKKNFTLKKIYKIHEHTLLIGFKKIYKK